MNIIFLWFLFFLFCFWFCLCLCFSIAITISTAIIKLAIILVLITPSRTFSSACRSLIRLMISILLFYCCWSRLGRALLIRLANSSLSIKRNCSMSKGRSGVTSSLSSADKLAMYSASVCLSPSLLLSSLSVVESKAIFQ